MRPSKSTFSFGRSNEGFENQNPRRARPQTSLDVLSSTTTPQTADGVTLDPVDLKITQGLLHPYSNLLPSTTYSRANGRQSSDNHSRHSFHPQDRLSSQAGQPSTFTLSRGTDSRVTSSTWTTISDRIVNGSSAMASRSCSGFSSEYNRLAHEYGLSGIPHDQDESSHRMGESKSDNSILQSLNQPSRSWLFRKFVRKTASTRNIKAISKKPINKKLSISDIRLLHSSRADRPNTKSLEDVARLGGVSIFVLPTEFSPCALVVPTCLAATGNHIAHHCWSFTKLIDLLHAADNIKGV